jgi:hypothetical protein
VLIRDKTSLLPNRATDNRNTVKTNRNTVRLLLSHNTDKEHHLRTSNRTMRNAATRPTRKPVMTSKVNTNRVRPGNKIAARSAVPSLVVYSVVSAAK